MHVVVVQTQSLNTRTPNGKRFKEYAEANTGIVHYVSNTLLYRSVHLLLALLCAEQQLIHFTMSILVKIYIIWPSTVKVSGRASWEILCIHEIQTFNTFNNFCCVEIIEKYRWDSKRHMKNLSSIFSLSVMWNISNNY